MGEDRGDASGREGRREEGVAFNAGASAPPAPPGVGSGFGDREVGIGPQTIPVPPDKKGAADRAATGVRTVRSPTPAFGSVAPPIPLATEDGRPVSVVHVVAELAPFARTGGLGEAVKSLA